PSAVGDGLWRERHNNYGARRLSRGLMISFNLVPLRRLPEAVETAARIRDKLKLNGSVQAHLVDSTTAALNPYVLMDDTRPSGGTALGFVKRMGMPLSRWTAIRWGSASSSSSTCGRCTGTRRRRTP